MTDDSARYVSARYLEFLNELKGPDRPKISLLRDLAKEHIDKASAISSTIVAHIKTCTPDQRLPALYLVDCIFKTVGEPYEKTFDFEDLVSFLWSHSGGDEEIQQRIRKTVQTWSDHLPYEIVSRLQERIQLPPVQEMAAEPLAPVQSCAAPNLLPFPLPAYTQNQEAPTFLTSSAPSAPAAPSDAPNLPHQALSLPLQMVSFSASQGPGNILGPMIIPQALGPYFVPPVPLPNPLKPQNAVSGVSGGDVMAPQHPLSTLSLAAVEEQSKQPQEDQQVQQQSFSLLSELTKLTSLLSQSASNIPSSQQSQIFQAPAQLPHKTSITRGQETPPTLRKVRSLKSISTERPNLCYCLDFLRITQASYLEEERAYVIEPCEECQHIELVDFSLHFLNETSH